MSESLQARGLKTVITKRWEIEDLSQFCTDDYYCRVVGGWVEVTEYETQTPVINWEWFDQDGDRIPAIDRRFWLVWMQLHLAPAIESNYLSVVCLNEIMRMPTVEVE